jgi:hypothetical protein
MREQKRITIYRAQDGEPMPHLIMEFIPWLIAKLESIPPDHALSAEIDAEVYYGYEDGSCADFTIFYFRDETDEEMSAREQNESRVLEAQKEQDLILLSQLKAKYENSKA